MRATAPRAWESSLFAGPFAWLESLERGRRHLSREWEQREKTTNYFSRVDNPVAASCLARSGSPGPLPLPCAWVRRAQALTARAICKAGHARSMGGQEKKDRQAPRLGARSLLFEKGRRQSALRTLAQCLKGPRRPGERPPRLDERAGRDYVTSPGTKPPRSSAFKTTKGPAKSESSRCGGGSPGHHNPS
jgi:hypothetical protein